MCISDCLFASLFVCCDEGWGEGVIYVYHPIMREFPIFHY